LDFLAYKLTCLIHEIGIILFPGCSIFVKSMKIFIWRSWPVAKPRSQ
jgi:hypothetical protein